MFISIEWNKDNVVWLQTFRHSGNLTIFFYSIIFLISHCWMHLMDLLTHFCRFLLDIDKIILSYLITLCFNIFISFIIFCLFARISKGPHPTDWILSISSQTSSPLKGIEVEWPCLWAHALTKKDKFSWPLFYNIYQYLYILLFPLFFSFGICS